MNIFCIGDEDTVRGFRLAGVAGEAVATAEQAAAALDRAVARRDCGLLLLAADTAAGIRAKVEARRSGPDQPLIVEVPGPAGLASGRKSLRQFVQEAIGMRLETEGGG